jgi:Flp pilus assembly protein TadB
MTVSPNAGATTTDPARLGPGRRDRSAVGERFLLGWGYRKPSFWWQLLSVAAFGTAGAIEYGVLSTLTLIGMTLVAIIGLVYLLWLRAERHQSLQRTPLPSRLCRLGAFVGWPGDRGAQVHFTRRRSTLPHGGNG